MNRVYPEIVYGGSVQSCRAWGGAPGELVLLRTSPLPRGCESVRVLLRVALCADRVVRKRLTLHPIHLEEDGLVTIRLPRPFPHALVDLRLCVDGVCSAPRMFHISEGRLRRPSRAARR